MSEFHGHIHNSQAGCHCHSHDLQPDAHCHSHYLQGNGHGHSHDLSGSISTNDALKASTCRLFCNITRDTCLEVEFPLHSHGICPWVVCREPRKCEPLIFRSDAIDFIKKAVTVSKYIPNYPYRDRAIYEDEKGRLLQYVCTYKDRTASGACEGFGGFCSYCKHGKLLIL